MLLKLLPALCIFITASTAANAQDIDFNQWQANCMALNPAMTGISNNPRIHFTYRAVHKGFQRPGDANPYARVIMGSYDQRISPKGGYIGISYMNDVSDNARIRTEAVMLSYARNYSIQLADKTGEGKFESDGKLNLRFGISLGGFEQSINSAYLRFTDYYNPRTGTIYDGNRRIPAEERLYTGIRPNFNTGIALNYNNIHGGFAIHNIIEPMVAFTANPTTRLPRRYSANIGAFLPLNPDNEKTTVLSPNFVYQRQNSITVLQPGININKGIFTGGVSYRFRDIGNLSREAHSLSLLAGISKGKFKAAYSYDLILKNSFQTAHELSLSVYLGKPREGSEKGIAYFFRKMGF